jgi:hypothetical protein
MKHSPSEQQHENGSNEKRPEETCSCAGNPKEEFRVLPGVSQLAVEDSEYQE